MNKLSSLFLTQSFRGDGCAVSIQYIPNIRNTEINHLKIFENFFCIQFLSESVSASHVS